MCWQHLATDTSRVSMHSVSASQGQGSLINLLSGAIAAMAAALAWIHRKVSSKLDDCENDREELWKTIASLQSKSNGEQK